MIATSARVPPTMEKVLLRRTRFSYCSISFIRECITSFCRSRRMAAIRDEMVWSADNSEMTFRSMVAICRS